jgi:hypothetical protein
LNTALDEAPMNRLHVKYPIAASYLAEVPPKKDRGRWLTGAFSLPAGRKLAPLAPHPVPP